MTFEKALAALKQIEGGFVDHPKDRGGPTNWGITERVARANGYTGEMQSMPFSEAARIYRAQYWEMNRLDAIQVHDEAVAHELFDSGVNCGTGNAARWLQRALNALNREGALYDDVKVDGQIGPATLAALRGLYATRGHKGGGRALLRYLDAQQGVYYLECAENRAANEEFTLGWALQRLGTV